jgi:hypothetical protein
MAKALTILMEGDYTAKQKYLQMLRIGKQKKYER